MSETDNPLLAQWADVMGLRGAAGNIRLDWYFSQSHLDLLMFRPPGGGSFDGYTKRGALVQRYAWAIPTHAALDMVAKYSAPGPGLLSIGAGTGYWEKLLAARGVDVLAYDRCPPQPEGKNSHGHTEQHFPVRRGTHRMVKSHPERTLFLCWPSYSEGWAAKALEWTAAQHVVYIGEGHGGCTADDTFHDHLEHDWEEVAGLPLPQWPGIHDRLTVHARKNKKAGPLLARLEE